MEETTEKVISENNEIVTAEKKSEIGSVSPANSDFDIVDFIISHSDNRSVIKKSKAPRIILCVIVGVLILTVCGLFVFWSVFVNKDPLCGSWVTNDGLVMTIDEKTITINGQTSEYTKDENNVIAIKMNNEYYKIIYELEGNDLIITIPNANGVETISYTRKSDQNDD